MHILQNSHSFANWTVLGFILQKHFKRIAKKNLVMKCYFCFVTVLYKHHKYFYNV